jgi:hypothetical protein
MPLNYQQDDVQRRVTVTPSDVVTIEEALEVLRQQIAREAWTYGTLYDARTRTNSLTGPEVRRLADFIEAQSAVHGPIGPTAILAPVSVTFGMGRLFEQISADTRQIAVFRDLDTAQDWLHHHQHPAPGGPESRRADGC